MRKLEIWMLDDGIPGHWSMTEGLVSLFSRICDVTPIRITVSWRLGAVRQPLQWLEKLGIRVPEFLVNALVRFSIPQTVGKPDFIVSRGGSTLFANVWLARKHGVPNIFIGTLRGLPERLFHVVVLQRDSLKHSPYFQMPAFPTRIDPVRLNDRATDFLWTIARPEKSTACMFLGGDGSGFTYHDVDWLGIARGMIYLHEKTGVQWCVSSSRRTPQSAEAIFRQELPASAIHEACWWHDGDRRPCMEAFLAVSDVAYCTSESMSMIEECINACKPTIALSPMTKHPDEAFVEFLQRREREGRITVVSIDDFTSDVHACPTGGWQTLGIQDMQNSAKELLSLLGCDF